MRSSPLLYTDDGCANQAHGDDTRPEIETREYYSGCVVAGHREGPGLIRWIDQTEYAGYWTDGRPEGCGVETYVDGSWYAGGFLDDSRHGFGGIWHANGVVYVGQWLVSVLCVSVCLQW